MMIPPTPCLEASLTPMKSGQSNTSSPHSVGITEASIISVLVSLLVVCSSSL
jgi:hypothetical protein